MAKKIIGYRGIANERELLVHGHLFKDYSIIDPHPGHRLWHNIRQAYLRYTQRTLPETVIEVKYDGKIYQTQSDQRGFFRCRLSANDIPEKGWCAYEYRFQGTDQWESGEFYAADERSTGVISDIDDTVLVSYSTKAIRKFLLIVARNAHTRNPFPFMERWYERLEELNEGAPPDDYYYVSDSEWNLYDFLVDFFQIHGIPKGIFLLKELRIGIRELLFGRREEPTTKEERIRMLFDFFEQKPFILVGDSGQEDMSVYAKIVREYPERVKGVMIRDLPYVRDTEKIGEHRAFFKEAKVPFQTFSNFNN